MFRVGKIYLFFCLVLTPSLFFVMPLSLMTGGGGGGGELGRLVWCFFNVLIIGFTVPMLNNINWQRGGNSS